MRQKQHNRDLHHLVPEHKGDDSHFEELKTLDNDEVEPILGELLVWLQDLNWPIARELLDILPQFHTTLAPHIDAVLHSDDDIWKCGILELIKKLPRESIPTLSHEIKRVAENPTPGELEEGAADLARELVALFRL